MSPNFCYAPSNSRLYYYYNMHKLHFGRGDIVIQSISNSRLVNWDGTYNAVDALKTNASQKAAFLTVILNQRHH